MFLNCHSPVEKISRRRIHSWHRDRLCPILITAFIVCLFPLSTVFGQMGQYAVYSDTWVDSSNPNAISIVGCGVTQDNQNYYGHTYWVVTTVTSASGRTATSTSYHSGSYARVETYLPWDWNDPGNYFIQTRHWMCCPYMGGNPYTGQGCYPTSTTSTTEVTGISRAQYVNAVQYNDGTGGFVPIAGCNVTCMPSSFIDTLHCNNQLEYRLRLQLWISTPVGRVCVPQAINLNTSCGAPLLAQCYDGP